MRRVLAGLMLATTLPGQSPPAPLPNFTDLLNQVRSHQEKLDEIRENYTFHQIETTEELDDRGGVRKSTSEEHEVFFVNAHRVARLITKNGVPLSASEDKKEQERVRKAVEQDMKQAHRERRGAGMISMVLAVTKISNPRRISLHGRPALAFDFTGDPNAKGHSIEQNAVKKTTGTIWFDEADRQVARVEVRFYENFGIAGGLLANVQKGSSVIIDQTPIGDGLWMQTSVEQHLGARIAFKSFRQNTHVRSFDFKKFDVATEQQIRPPADKR